ncbi:MAG: hypothetical protein ABSD30_15845, partial [Candidatus Binatus sp.]
PSTGETPFNTTEIGPSSMNSTPPPTGSAPAYASTYSTSTTTTASTIASAPPYSASAGRYATTGVAPIAPLDSGAGTVPAGGGFAAPASGLDATKGVTPGVAP